MLVICNGMSRSGSTFQYNLARCAVLTTEQGEAHGYIANEADDHVYSIPDTRFIEWAEDDRVHVVKMHPVHRLLPEMIGTGAIRVLYIYRDIRDVAVSTKRVWGLRGEKLLYELDRLVTFYDRLEALRDAAPNYVLWQRYEEVMARPAEAAGEIFDFLEIDLDEKTFEAVLQFCSIDTAADICAMLRRDLETHVVRLRAHDPRAAADFLQRIRRSNANPSLVIHADQSLLLYNHISRDKGASGVWKTALNAREQEVITERYREWLERVGYE